MIFLIALGYIVLLVVHIFCPPVVKVVLTLINVFFPDPLPFVDEIIMAITTIVHFKNS